LTPRQTCVQISWRSVKERLRSTRSQAEQLESIGPTEACYSHYLSFYSGHVIF